MQQASRPPSHRRWVWRSRRVCDVGDGSLPGAIRLVQQLPRLMPAVEGVVPGRRRPVGQHRKCLVAWATTAPANPDPLVPFVVRIFEALSVTDDGPLAANRAQPGEQFQRDLGHPGSVLFSGSGSAIKRITAGVKAGPDRRCQVSIWWLAFTLQVKSVPNEKRISRSAYCPHDLVSTLAGLKRQINKVTEPAVGISRAPLFPAMASATARLGHYWKVRVGHFCRAPKRPCLALKFMRATWTALSGH